MHTSLCVCLGSVDVGAMATHDVTDLLCLTYRNHSPFGGNLKISQVFLGSGLASEPPSLSGVSGTGSHVVLVSSVRRPGELKVVFLDWL